MDKKSGNEDIPSEFGMIHKDSRGMYIVSDYQRKAEKPAISIFAHNVPGAWELAMTSVWQYGARIGTHYDNTTDTPKSKEATVTINITNPLNQPRLSRPATIGGPIEYESYVQEVVNGIHDNKINPRVNKWSYTYHERLFNYNVSTDLYAEDRGLLLPKGIDQIELVVDDLERDITSKGAQATTWMPTADPMLESNRPCLQRLWFRPYEDGEGGYLLNADSHWRSRDLAKAWIMNVGAIVELQGKVAEMLEDRIGKKVRVGSYLDMSNSLHIYGDYFLEYKNMIESLKSDENFEKRCLKPGDAHYPGWEQGIKYAKEQLEKDPDYFMKGGK